MWLRLHRLRDMAKATLRRAVAIAKRWHVSIDQGSRA